MTQAFFQYMETAPDGPLGVAVSGGGDSLALLVLMAEWAKPSGRSLSAVTVDHGLRKDSAAEAQMVAQLCAGLGVPHTTLEWRDHPERGNLQDNARQARQRLIAQWALERGIAAVATGHTKEDQAETLLLRLKRGSGVDGLSGILPQRRKEGVLWLRPTLEMRRETLRDVLRVRQIPWAEDPSNDDVRFDRVKMRKALVKLDEIGLTVDVLADTATRLQPARAALEQVSETALRRIASPRDIGSVRLDINALACEPEEIRLRILAHSLRWVSAAPYRPRLNGLKRALAACLGGRSHSLSGCLLTPLGNGVCEITREVAAMQECDGSDGFFDGRFACDTGVGSWRPLGKVGILQRPEWRETAESRNAILASPSLWYNNELKSAPFVDKNPDCKCWLRDGPESFYATIVTH
ncbi:tRNA lysidine(34) synthetase TilS [Neptunicoccus sediminis]|uniref:tRNA lysidine(34) synthetase TilS n=1 Tax=Neptunicoccus sediminis TaxID=1892596 RepID=UPI000845ECAA|nr:tRNA lysidine(34) synthetase TilS [Neptunicoccus sediminis]